MNEDSKPFSEVDYWLGITARKRSGRKRLGPNKKQKAVVFLTPWFLAAMEWVRDQEEARTGKRPLQPKALRGLLQMGLDTYRQLMTLPAVER